MTAQPSPELSVVVPVHDEAENLADLIREVEQAMAAGPEYEIVYVDDGSRDGTPERLAELAADRPRLRVLRHRKCCGQSAAVASGVKAARGRFIATLDGDGQNDPADIPAMLQVLKAAPDPDFLLVAGHRTQRRDTAVKRFSSRIANAVRARLLGDATPDTGCGLKLFTRRAFLDLPRFDHMHRFLPALMIRRGGRVESVAVGHRHRQGGRSKYGTLDRLMVGIVDLLGVMWLKRRACLPEVEELSSSGSLS